MEYAAALMLGLAGGFHCAGMCGPFAITVGRSWGYLAGRIITYAILGLILGAGADLLTLGRHQQTVSIIAGVCMIVLAAIQLTGHISLIPSAPILRLTAPVRSSLQQLLTQRTPLALLGIGMLNGLLPCGLVISALVGAAGTTSAIGGALFMAVFGIGTLPVIASFAFGGGWLRQRLPSRFRLALPVLALFLGAAIVVRGMGLGVPYLSPKPPAIIEEAGCCSHPANR